MCFLTLLEGDRRAACFLRLLPVTRVKNAVTLETNEHLHQPLSFRELTKFLGLWVIAVRFPGASRSKLFSTSKITSTWDSDSPEKLHHSVRSCRLEELNQSTQFTKNELPSRKVKFHEVRELITTFNDCSKKKFMLGRVYAAVG